VGPVDTREITFFEEDTPERRRGKMQAAAAARTRVEPATPKVETEYDYDEVVRALFAAEPATPTTTPAAERGNSH